MPFTSVPGSNIYWKLEGPDEAPVLVLLNSIGTDMDLWDRLLPSLRSQYRLLRIDTRGHGASSAGSGDFSLLELARDVVTVANEAGIQQFSVAGVSLGGMIGMELALFRPLQVVKLALVCTSATMDVSAWSTRVQRIRESGMEAIAELAMGRFLSPQFSAENPDIHATILRQLLAMDPRGYAGCGAAIRDMQLAERISGIICPTLVVTGNRDTSTPYEGHGEYLLSQIPGAIHAPIDAAHLAPVDGWSALERALTSFLQS